MALPSDPHEAVITALRSYLRASCLERRAARRRFEALVTLRELLASHLGLTVFGDQPPALDAEASPRQIQAGKDPGDGAARDPER